MNLRFVLFATLLSLTTAKAQSIAMRFSNIPQSPVKILSSLSTLDFAFRSAVVLNGSEKHVDSVTFQLQTIVDGQSSVAATERIAVAMRPLEQHSIEVTMGRITRLVDSLKSSHKSHADAVLQVVAVKFEDGTSWSPN